jgi:hypothetical protein
VAPIYECLWILKIFNFSPVWRKTNQNFVFLDRDPHIPYQLYITVPYMSFYGFWKIWNILSKCVGVTLDFTEITTLGAKTYRNIIFLGRDLHIPHWLYIAGPYMSLFTFWKIDFFSKSIDVILQFYWKSPIWGKNRSKLHISWLWSAYDGSVIHNGPIYMFLWILKKFKFSLKMHRC